ncbi:unnamed protein product [Clonostachys solani]|uniref:Uncharacterized protein n=1 Tax=Clonostachys solani TaxID=160281 RepID=A0A9N9ZP09_9HYPO|nr:unnamed protein product [Clonostachys solani]
MAAQEQASKGESCPLSDTDSDTTHVAEEGGNTDQVQSSPSLSRAVGIRRRRTGVERSREGRNDDQTPSSHSLPKIVSIRKRASEPECSGTPDLRPEEGSSSAALRKTQNNGKRRGSLEIEEICDKAENGETAKNSSESQNKGGSTEADSDPGNLREPKATGLHIQSIESITAHSSDPTLVMENQPRGVIGGVNGVGNNDPPRPPNCSFSGYEIDVLNDDGVREIRLFIPYTSRIRTKSDARSPTARHCAILAATWQSHRCNRVDHYSKAPQQTVFNGDAPTARLLKD